jgi:tetratricopeptide (TPR) repeat protein
LRSVPAGGALFVETDDAFGLLYLHQVLGERPDVRLYDRNGVLFRDPFAAAGLPPRPGESPLAHRTRVELELAERGLMRDAATPATFLGWPGYDVPPRLRLEPVGLTSRITRAVAPLEDDRPVWAAYHDASVREQAERTGNGFALALAATYTLARGERELFLGRRGAAYALFDEAASFARDSASLQNYIGTLYARSGDLERAIAAFERALELRPSSSRARANLAQARGH